MEAVKERPEPKIALSAFTNSNNRITIRVADNGTGIPQDLLDKIFVPFFTTRRGQGGSGLGMHIVYSLVTQVLEGSIDCESSPGAGTRFLIRFAGDVLKQRDRKAAVKSGG
jgi:signal transduction histidine kinase